MTRIWSQWKASVLILILAIGSAGFAENATSSAIITVGPKSRVGLDINKLYGYVGDYIEFMYSKGGVVTRDNGLVTFMKEKDKTVVTKYKMDFEAIARVKGTVVKGTNSVTEEMFADFSKFPFDMVKSGHGIYTFTLKGGKIHVDFVGDGVKGELGMVGKLFLSKTQADAPQEIADTCVRAVKSYLSEKLKH